MCQMHGLRERKRGRCHSELVKIRQKLTLCDNKEHRHFIQNVKAMPGKFQHALVVADIDRKKIRKVVRKTCADRRKISLLKDVKISKLFNEKVTELVDVGAPNLWGHFKDGILRACDEVCGKKRVRRSEGDT